MMSKKVIKSDKLFTHPDERPHFLIAGFGIMNMPQTPLQELVEEDLESGITIRRIDGKDFLCVSPAKRTFYPDGNSVRGLGSTLKRDI